MFNKKPNNQICKMQKAGTWYPSDPVELRHVLDLFFDRVNVSRESKPRLIVVPHPGLIYGINTASYSYKLAGKFKYKNIFLLGVSHLSIIKDIIVGDFDFYQTPLGDIKGNRDISSFLFYKSTKAKFVPQLIEQDHILEMQYPFIKKCFPEANLIPIVISTPESALALADLLYQVITPDDLIIVSSDFSHYPSYELAKKEDLATIDLIVNQEISAFLKRSQEQDALKKIETYACGAFAIVSGLTLLSKLNVKTGELLHYENSGDTPVGNKESVVGYGAIAFYADDNETFYETVNLSKSEKLKLLEIARTTITNLLKAIPLEEIQNIDPDSLLNKPYGAFVTLTKNGRLRGCMGNFEPSIPLYKVIQQTAVTAAFRDPRFSMVNLNELNEIKIDISVLSPRKSIKSYQEIVPGKHGVYIEKGVQGGTYLPQVALEQNWNREEMMNSLCQEKAGIAKESWQNGKA
ncbi:MAG: AmmeMemoRadiSam system protein B, partial [Candidatus Margulisiibacteriota bacterium]